MQPTPVGASGTPYTPFNAFAAGAAAAAAAYTPATQSTPAECFGSGFVLSDIGASGAGGGSAPGAAGDVQGQGARVGGWDRGSTVRLATLEEQPSAALLDAPMDMEGEAEMLPAALQPQ
jgi:hypothetical protein